MVQAVGTFSSYDASGNREDLIDNIFNVDPVETPVLSGMKKTSATATNHEWQTDTLAAAGANAHIEGDDASPAAAAATTRLGNQTQIFKEHVVVSGTQEAVNKAGRGSEIGYQMEKRIKEIKLDIEWAMLNGGSPEGNAKVVGNDTTAREMGSLQTYLTTNTSAGTSGADPTGDGTDIRTTGTNRALTEGIVETTLQSIWTNSDSTTNLNMIVNAFNKGVVSDFTTAATRYVSSDDKRLTASIDVYDGDFHTVTIVPDRQTNGENAYILDYNYLADAELRGMSSRELAKTGDTERYEIVTECTLEVCNEAAHGGIYDLNAS